MAANLVKRPKFCVIALKTSQAKAMAVRLLETYVRKPHCLLDADAQEMARLLHAYLLKIRACYEGRLLRLQKIQVFTFNMHNYQRWRICKGDVFFITVFAALSIFDTLVYAMDLSIKNYLITKKEYKEEIMAIERRIEGLVQRISQHVI